MPNETMLKILFNMAEQNQEVTVTFLSSNIIESSAMVANLLRAGAPKVILLLEEQTGDRRPGYLDKEEIKFFSAMIAALDYRDNDPLEVKARSIHGLDDYVQLTITIAK